MLLFDASTKTIRIVSCWPPVDTMDHLDTMDPMDALEQMKTGSLLSYTIIR